MIETAVLVALIAIIAIAGVRAVGHSVADRKCKTAGEILNGEYSWDGSTCKKDGLGL